MLSEAASISPIAAQFSIMSPISDLGVFAGMTADRTAAEARQPRSGSLLLDVFGVTVDSLCADVAGAG